jgi:hypothetical protein
VVGELSVGVGAAGVGDSGGDFAVSPVDGECGGSVDGERSCW